MDCPQNEIYTKRQVASRAAKVFNPIGLITPFTARSKMLLQKLWMQGIGWNEDIPIECCRKWTQWLNEIKELESLSIPRCYVELLMNRYSRLELHAFGDASELAYASAVCLRAVSSDGHISTRLVMSKCRIARVKRVTLPRLELMAAVITARLCTYWTVRLVVLSAGLITRQLSIGYGVHLRVGSHLLRIVLLKFKRC